MMVEVYRPWRPKVGVYPPEDATRLVNSKGKEIRYHLEGPDLRKWWIKAGNMRAGHILQFQARDGRVLGTLTIAGASK